MVTDNKIKSAVRILSLLGLGLLIQLTSGPEACAQDNDKLPLKQLKINDTVPEVILKTMIGYKSETARVSDFKGKLLILDFWASWCSPCMTKMPELQALQKQFKDQLTILPVNSRNTRDGIQKAKNALAKNQINLPSVVQDDYLDKLFPHKALPYEVWIDAGGKVLAMSSADEVNEIKIKEVLAGRSSSLKQKRVALEQDDSKPLAGVIRPDSEVLYRSILTGFRDDVNGGFNRDQNGNTKRVYLGNSWPSAMFEVAAFPNFMKKSGRIIYEVTDTLKWKTPTIKWTWPNAAWNSIMEWKQTNQTYELIMPASTPDSVFYPHMLHELNMLFPLKGNIENKSMPCWNLVRIDPSKAIPKSSGGKAGGNQGVVTTKGDLELKMQNVSMAYLVTILNMFEGGDEIFDETNWKENIDLTIDYSKNKTYNEKLGLLTNSPMDFEVVQEGLAKYNLKLVRAKRKLPVLTLSDKPEIYSRWKL